MLLVHAENGYQAVRSPWRELGDEWNARYLVPEKGNGHFQRKQRPKRNVSFNFRNKACITILLDSYTFGSQNLCKDFETLIVTVLGKITSVSYVSKPGNQNNEDFQCFVFPASCCWC